MRKRGQEGGGGAYLNELLQASIKPSRHGREIGAVVSQGTLVVVDEVKIVLGGHVVVTPQLVQEPAGEGAHTLVDDNHMTHNLVSDL